MISIGAPENEICVEADPFPYSPLVYTLQAIPQKLPNALVSAAKAVQQSLKDAQARLRAVDILKRKKCHDREQAVASNLPQKAPASRWLLRHYKD